MASGARRDRAAVGGGAGAAARDAGARRAWEVARRRPRLWITGPELEDLAYQAAADALLAITQGRAKERYPGLAAHLRACGPCGEDFEVLLAAVRGGEPVGAGNYVTSCDLRVFVD